MRCADAIRELATPTGEADAAELARHLASCSSCASQAERDRQLDRIWQATRPETPPASAWERVWEKVTLAADRPATIPFEPPAAPHRSYWLAVAAVAQAAAALIAGALFFQSRETPADAKPAAVVAGSSFEFELDEGQTLFLEVGERADRVVCRPKLVETQSLVAYDFEDTTDPQSEALAMSMDLLSGMETLE